MKIVIIYGILFFLAFNVNAQPDSLICKLHRAISSFPETAKDECCKELFTHKNDTIYLIKTFITTNQTDTLYTGFLNFSDDSKIIVSTSGEFYHYGNICWLSIDSIAVHSDSLLIFLHNQSYSVQPNTYFFNLIIAFVDNDIKMIKISENKNYLPIDEEIISVKQEEVLSNFRKISSFYIRHQNEYLIECNQ